MNLAIIVPTYNESKNIQTLLSRIKDALEDQLNLSTTVYVVDDNSPDGTSEAVIKHRKYLNDSRFKVVLLNKPTKEGLGKAYLYGFRRVLKSDCQAILQMDADLSHDPDYIPNMLELFSTTDMVVGSRYMSGGAIPDWKLHRRILSRGGNLYARAILDSRITDYTGGFNLYAADLLRKIKLEEINTPGYGFIIELKWRALRQSGSIAQTPIIFSDRQHGKSKIPKNTLLNNLLLVPKLRLQDLRRH